MLCTSLPTALRQFAPLGSAALRMSTRGLLSSPRLRLIGLRLTLLGFVLCVTIFGPWSVSMRCLWLSVSLMMLVVSPHRCLLPNPRRRRRSHQALAGDRRPLLAVLAPLVGFIVGSRPAVSFLSRLAISALRSVVGALGCIFGIACRADCATSPPA